MYEALSFNFVHCPHLVWPQLAYDGLVSVRSLVFLGELQAAVPPLH